MSESERLRAPGKPLNLTTRFLESNIAAGRGAKTALIVDDPTAGIREWTYLEIVEGSAQYAAELAARGIGLEDRVLLLLPDGVEWVLAFFGAQKVGATTLFLNPSVGRDEVAFYLEDSRARAVITARAMLEKLPDERPFLRTVLTVDDPETRAALAARPTRHETAATLEEDFAVWLYSSGSTGAPKAAVHRAYDFVFNTERYAKNVLQMSEHDRTLSVPKLFFGYATGSNLLFPFYFGGTAILFPDKPTPKRLYELIERHRATVLVNVPTMIAQMADSWDAGESSRDVSSLRVVTSAGEALPPELYHRWKSGPAAEILDGIGSAEMFHVFISARFGQVVPGSVGTLVEGYEAKIVDPEGGTCAPGEIGTLWVAGDSAAAFYWQRHEKSRDVLRGRWVVTSDQFVCDDDGYFFYQGRADDMMKVAGRWVSPQEIESALLRHEAVAEAAAAPFRQNGLTKPMAFVIPRQDVAPTDALSKELSDHVAAGLAPYKAPRFVEFVDRLPRGDRDKLARPELASMAQAAAARRGIVSEE